MHTKILIRTDSFSEHYQHWLQRDVKDIIEILSGSYANEVFGKGSEDLKYEQSDSFKKIIWQPAFLNQQTFGFLIDLFKTKLIAFAGYQLNLSDERNEIFDNGLRFTTHRHYLKPTFNKTELIKLQDQVKFNNLILEHRFNKQYNAFYLTANFNKDAHLTSFEKLMEFLLY